MTTPKLEDDTTHSLYTPSLKTVSSLDMTTPTETGATSFASRFPPPPRPQSSREKESSLSNMAQFGADSTLGQFSFAPATQTTVVTTTTTTTTRFPPFVMRAPRRMQDLDPKLYPLAATPTPSSLKNISFDLGGKQTIFREAEDTTVAMEQIEQENEILKSNGAVQTVQTFRHDPQQASSSFGLYSRRSTPRERPASPDSITDAQDSTHSTRSTRATRRQESSLAGPASLPHLRTLQSNDPSTPETDLRERRKKRRRLPAKDIRDDASNIEGSPLSPSVSQQNTPSTGESSHNITSRRLRSSHGEQATPSTSRPTATDNNVPTSNIPHSQTSVVSVVPTPPIQGDERQFAIPAVRRNLSSIPARLAAVDTVMAQDGSLPSPSLSPVTAAANLQNAGYFADIDSNSEMASQQDHDMSESSQIYDSASAKRIFDLSALNNPTRAPAEKSPSAKMLQSSINDIPAMLDFFEAIPDELKSYVMHQLLRRCPKPTLHLVADVVNPALRCDFVGILPPELSLNILKYLDAKSLCRASQVSKKWRHIVNGDEQAWKDLFDADGLSLPQGELQRAILEGWGWQDPTGIDGYEQDISGPSGFKSESDTSLSTSVMHSNVSKNGGLGTTTSGRRPKRKAASKLSSRNKQLKRRETSVDISEKLESVDLMGQMSSAEGPYNAANAAAMAVPYPKVGLSSLKDLHLYKSLYRRHHLIRKNWMREDAKPRHIAFRAHDRHVVTCLGFDDDKIVTGSDDTNINVYDTKTGALRAKLRGHEGGVWALQYEGNVLVSGSTDRSVRVWDIENGRQMQVFQGHTSTVRCLQILSPTKVGETPDGKAIMMPKQPLIITGSRDSNLRVWKLPQPEDAQYFQAGPPQEDTDCPYFVRVLTGHQHSVRAIAAHADTLVSGSYDCTVRVWKISTGETVHRLTGHTQKVYSVVLDDSRNRCISGSMDNLVKIWSLDTGSILYTLDGHSSLVGLLDLNSERLVSAAADSTLRIWDPENGQCKATLSAHTGAITCFQHDGQKVISGSDRTLKMWNVRNGDCVKDLLTDLSGVWQVKFNERRCVAAVQRDNMTYIEVSHINSICEKTRKLMNQRRSLILEQREMVSQNRSVVNASSWMLRVRRSTRTQQSWRLMGLLTSSEMKYNIRSAYKNRFYGIAAGKDFVCSAFFNDNKNMHRRHTSMHQRAERDYDLPCMQRAIRWLGG
jgi:F-box and WD-40 domain protein CDC4